MTWEVPDTLGLLFHVQFHSFDASDDLHSKENEWTLFTYVVSMKDVQSSVCSPRPISAVSADKTHPFLGSSAFQILGHGSFPREKSEDIKEAVKPGFLQKNQPRGLIILHSDPLIPTGCETA